MFKLICKHHSNGNCMKHKQQSGFGIFGLLLVCATIGVIGLAGWSVFNVRKTYDPAADTTKAPVKLTTYQNPEFGFSFSYPAAWGNVQTAAGNIAAGISDPKLLFSGSFDKNKKTVFTLAPKEYTIPASTFDDTSCFYNGFGTFAYLLAETDSDDYFVTELLRTSDRQIIEEYKNGYCAGQRMRGRISLPLARSNGIDLTYFAQEPAEHDDETDEQLTIEDYMNIRSNLIKEDIKQQFIQTVLSFKTL